MADTYIKISELEETTLADDASFIPIDNGNHTYKISVENYNSGANATAQSYAEAAAASADDAETAKTAAEAAETETGLIRTATQQYATAAAGSAANAAASAIEASTYAEGAATSEANAEAAAQDAADYATLASDKATLAQSWAVGDTHTRTGEDTNNASYYANQAQGAYENALEQADAAGDSADAAASSASDAADSATAAAGSAGDASDYATAASGSATAAATSATQSANSAGAAATSATNAAASATAASGSASTATTQANNAAQSATTAGGYATQAASSASDASGYATNAANSATAAAGSATTASNQATAAAGSATAAAASASDAADSAADAAESAATFTTDDTLSIAGKAADAKAAGDMIAAVQAEIPELDNWLTTPGAAAEAKHTGDRITEVEDDVTALKSAIKNTDNELFDYSYTPSSMVWESGSIYASSGTNLASGTRIRTATAELLPGDVIGIQVVNGYKVSIYAWQSDNTYVGVWQGGTFAKTPKFLTGFIFVADLVKTYKYRLVLGKTDDSAMTTADYTGCLVARSKFLTVNANIGHVYQSGAIVPILNQLAIKTKNVFDSFTINAGSYSFVVGESTVANYRDYAASSSVSKNTPPIRIRDFNGDLIYKNLRLSLDKPDKATTCMWLFDKNGYYLRAVTHSNFYHRTAYFLDDEYYAILNLFPGVTGYTDYAWIVDNVNIEWLNQKPEYHVGSNKEFTTVIAMLTALADDPREKTVYIDPGVYDIFEEYGGADYMASLADTASSLNWRDVCKVVPPNTTIIGLGDVTLTWDASAADMQSASVAVLFSPLNVSGNCTIENIKVIGRNCRYAVHDETSGLEQYNGAIHHYKNCYFECLESTYNATTPYGSGHNKNMQLIFDNCEFVNYQNLAWATHHQAATAVEKSTIIFNHCIFRCSRVNADFAVQFATDKANGLKDQVRFNDCYVAAKLKFYTTSESNVQQGYDVILIGSSHVDLVYSDNITTRYDVLQYNAFT